MYVHTSKKQIFIRLCWWCSFLSLHFFSVSHHFFSIRCDWRIMCMTALKSHLINKCQICRLQSMYQTEMYKINIILGKIIKCTLGTGQVLALVKRYDATRFLLNVDRQWLLCFINILRFNVIEISFICMRNQQ